MVEGTSLLRKHMGISLYRGFESLALRQDTVLSTPKYPFQSKHIETFAKLGERHEVQGAPRHKAPCRQLYG